MAGRDQSTVVDWGLAGRVGRGVSGGDERGGLDPAGTRDACERALELVRAYTGLEPEGDLPAAEIVSRHEWIATNLTDLRELAAPIEARAAGEIALPGPLAGFMRAGVGAAAGIEAGVTVGYASRRVLGQYQVALTPRPRPPRMLLVGRNVSSTARELEVDAERFLLWVAIHEQTHALQFASVPWLREHLARLVERLITNASRGIDFSGLAALGRRMVSGDPRRALREVMRGELARALAGPEQAAIIDELQAVMAVVEGHAEHVMDAAAGEDPELARMRRLMTERRSERGGLADVIARILGLGMKLRQYELGKAWADAVTAQAGMDGLNRVWDEPGALPTAHELEHPAGWTRRVVNRSVA